MSKRRLTHREQLRNMIKEAESDSILNAELVDIQISLEKPRYQAVTELIKLLKVSSQRDTQWFISKVFGTVKDERVIQPLMRAAQASENKNYRSTFLWALEKYDCTKHLSFFVNFITELDDPDEAMMVSIEIIRAMKGPFEPILARKSI